MCALRDYPRRLLAGAYRPSGFSHYRGSPAAQELMSIELNTDTKVRQRRPVAYVGGSVRFETARLWRIIMLPKLSARYQHMPGVRANGAGWVSNLGAPRHRPAGVGAHRDLRSAVETIYCYPLCVVATERLGIRATPFSKGSVGGRGRFAEIARATPTDVARNSGCVLLCRPAAVEEIRDRKREGG